MCTYSLGPFLLQSPRLCLLRISLQWLCTYSYKYICTCLTSYLTLHGLFDSCLVVCNVRHTYLKSLTLNWDGNLHENFKSFKIHASVLLEGPYSRYDPADKVAAFLSWMGNKGFHLYDSIKWGTYKKEEWADILKAFKEHFKPYQTVM